MKLFYLLQWLLPVGLLRLCFGGDSSTTQTTEQYDQRKVLGQGAVLAEGASSISITNTTLDANVANNAISAISDTSVRNLNKALTFGGDNLKRSLTFGGDNLKQSLTFGGDNLKRSLTFGGDNLKQSLTFGGDTLTKAFSFGRASLDQSAASESKVLDSLDTQTNLVKDAYADAKGRGALTDKILIGAIAMAGLVAIFAVKGK